jgi:hypothetical protein
MAKCTIHLQQPMPPVCLCCGADATHLAKQTFVNSNPWLLWTTLLGTWYYNWVVLHIPLCNAHRNTIRYRWVGPFLFLVLGGLGIFASWGVYSTLYGREASDAIAGYVGAAVAIIFVIFYIALLTASFTKPHISRVNGDWITLTQVSDRFAAVVAGDESASQEPAVMTAELVDEAIPTAALAGAPSASPFSTPKPAKCTSWAYILVSSAVITLIFLCGGMLGLTIYSLNNKTVWLDAKLANMPHPIPGITAFQVEHRKQRDIPANETYIWMVEYSGRTMQLRQSTAAELSTDGKLDMQIFDTTADVIKIWIEAAPTTAGERQRISNIARIWPK